MPLFFESISADKTTQTELHSMRRLPTAAEELGKVQDTTDSFAGGTIVFGSRAAWILPGEGRVPASRKGERSRSERRPCWDSPN
jgi:hypothetical protein